MKKGMLAIVVCLGLVAAAMVGSNSWAQKTPSGEVQDEINIESPVFPKHRKPAVHFTHKKHSVDYKLKCDSCHHDYKDGKNMWKEGDKVQKCEACHTSPKKNKGKLLSLMNAFHKNCKACHKEVGDPKKAPTKCNGCHKK
ncbi:cytochrome c3 family protein [Dethiosulfatarculus sandiegensis]|uniref:Chain A cytochrome C3 From Desulfomicrobium Baculatus n=1 Tax=Dethiosulfatarculus sandiegensis TaxID=1429043 RepID=A0A0D2JNK8_9BACT|nr:cytochrome c3 family protein [Dethiosulfatarculus sandiegensis]KIX11070.1 chain A cytochrome C3 From Desulfomicrobium Baculatus [Dethiosulfatarculus sandiegensis]